MLRSTYILRFPLQEKRVSILNLFCDLLLSTVFPFITLITMKGKTGKNNKSQKDLEYWPFSTAAETLIYMLIGALTTRAKAMSSQSKYQWNEIEWKIHRVFLCGRRRRKKYAQRIFVLPLLLGYHLGYITYKT